ncbi:hypothetical protein [Oerskovia paurometabola]|uniref:hypothetical protein n=1 Tax=Oerskovia paurometabola TaxID=162170 RepID=UPI0037F5AF7F
MNAHTYLCAQCGRTFIANPGGRLNHRMLYAHSATVAVERSIWDEARQLSEKGGAA